MQHLNILTALAATIWGGSIIAVGGAYIGCFFSRRIQRAMLG